MPGFLFNTVARIALRRGLAKQGLSRAEIRDKMDLVDDDMIEGATHEVGHSKVVGAIGDGTILQKIVDFFNSDLGKALIALLMKILLGGLLLTNTDEE